MSDRFHYTTRLSDAVAKCKIRTGLKKTKQKPVSNTHSLFKSQIVEKGMSVSSRISQIAGFRIKIGMP